MFNQINVDQALAYVSGSNIKRVLVVGSGEGADMIALRNRLGPEPLIVGIDIDIHAERFPCIANTFVIQADITKDLIMGNCFDIAYSFATFEHIQDLQLGWQAMLDVLQPGGLLWSVSSPLWCSPYGHHKPMFREHPWIHLQHPDPESLLEFCLANAIEADDGIAMIHHLNYLFNPACFNRHPTSAYRQAVAGLRNANVEVNDFDYIEATGFEAQISELIAIGHQPSDLLAQTHRLIARRC